MPSRKGNASTTRCIRVSAIASTFPQRSICPRGSMPRFPRTLVTLVILASLQQAGTYLQGPSLRPGGRASARSGYTDRASSPGMPPPCPCRSRSGATAPGWTATRAAERPSPPCPAPRAARCLAHCLAQLSGAPRARHLAALGAGQGGDGLSAARVAVHPGAVAPDLERQGHGGGIPGDDALSVYPDRALARPPGRNEGPCGYVQARTCCSEARITGDTSVLGKRGILLCGQRS